MASTLEKLQANIDAAITPGFRYQILARGQSRGMIWREGLLPEDAPNYGSELTDDLLSYGYSLLLHGLRYIELGGDVDRARSAFAVAAEALEAAAAKGKNDPERDFHCLIAAAAYHLGRFSARAYSMLYKDLNQANLSTIERGLANLILRNLSGLSRDIEAWFGTSKWSDDALGAVIAQPIKMPNNEESGDKEDSENRILEVLTMAVDENFLAALATGLLAMERGENDLIPQAQTRLKKGLDVTGELSLVSQWWCHRLAIHLLDSIWDSSFHQILPVDGPPHTDIGDWSALRKLFIGSLYCRDKAEIDFWPSQLLAAQRALEFSTNLVLSLPTSAGKTRIAELCILACLATKKRVIFVTPLRALSAQTEIGLRRTFTPLGKTVSSLYGSIGVSGTDVDALRSRDIVVATPEKLDFALRSDPTLLDDVGLVVLDEGHMIGLGEREVRYEAQIQRLLRRSDSMNRRIVCLSAILPNGDQLEDFSAWLTNDKTEGLIKNDWRPTRMRFGEVVWKGNHAQLNISVGDEKPYILKFLVAKKPTKGRATKMFPADQRELCIATAWRLVEDGQTVLIFCPLRRSVLPFAEKIVQMHKRGNIESVLKHPMSVLATALAVGAEWLGPDHDILKCLMLGVAVHHGALPTPYRKEVEHLLRDGVLRVTISSPTLAQGLNLSATSLVFHGVNRNGELIDIAEFRNVVGRAGRAYIDIEGLVLYPMFDDHRKRNTDWQALISNQRGREMESGLLRLVVALLQRMQKKLGNVDRTQFIEYIAGQAAWEFPLVVGEEQRRMVEAYQRWETHLMSLDTAIFSLLGDTSVPDEEIENTLDKILGSSLFERRLLRYSEEIRELLKTGLQARARFIWLHSTPPQRRGYFLAGVGLATGIALDSRAVELGELLLLANSAVLAGEQEIAVENIIEFAKIAFQIPPFSPKRLIDDWESLLKCWLLGQPISNILLRDNDETIQFIEQAFVFNLPWAMEAVRVRAKAHDDPFSDNFKLSDFSRAYAVIAVETGSLLIPTSILIQAGFSSRLGAINAVVSTSADFKSIGEMMTWLTSEKIQALSRNPDWPTPESHRLWTDFISSRSKDLNPKVWISTLYSSPVIWHDVPMPPGMPLRLGGGLGKEKNVYSADYREVGVIGWTPNPAAKGIIIATANGTKDHFDVEYIGPGDMLVSQTI